MPNRRSKLFWLSTVAVASMTMAGCYEEEFKPQQNTTQQGQNNITQPDMSGTEIVKKLDSECYNSEKCMDSSKCTGDKAYIACKCVTEKRCSIDPQCRGISDSGTSGYKCEYTCGETIQVGGEDVDTCNWLVCSNTQVCIDKNKGECNPNTIGSENPEGDYDEDGIINRIEANSSFLDPCKADTDNDGVPDGLEDLNGDGKIDETLGETHPNNPNSKPNIDGGEAAVRAEACSAKYMKGNFMTFNGTAVAQFGGSSKYSYKKYAPNGKKDYIILDDAKTKVYGFFFRNEIPFEGKILLQKAVTQYLGDKVTAYFEESNFKRRVPENSWLDNDYDKQLQRVPDHTVQRVKYALTLNGKVTPSEVRDAIAKAVTETPDNVTASTSEACTGDTIRVYLARSMYDSSTIFSFGVACDESLKATDSSNQMEDILSGTMVASDSYKPFEDFMCQTKLYGDASGAIDFIWVVDNSGSMVDEQEAVAATVDEFVRRLKSSGVDYRLAVTTTDAYSLDEADEGSGYNIEWPEDNYSDINRPSLLLSGLRPYFYNQAMQGYQGFIPSTEPNVGKAFATAVTNESACIGVDGIYQHMDYNKRPNVCGYGREDGLKSLETVLERISTISMTLVKQSLQYSKWNDPETKPTSVPGKCRVDDTVAPDCFKASEDDDGTACYNQLLAQYTSDTTKYKDCLKYLTSVRLRDEALKYVIWISDEASRQFKEEGVPLGVPAFPRGSGDGGRQRTLPICQTGYELETMTNITEPTGFLSMVHGPCGAANPNCSLYACTCEKKCNPTMPGTLIDADRKFADFERGEDGKYAINETTNLSDLKEGKYKPQHDMLMYYMTSYLKYAGTGGIAGFAIVGDDKETGGSCEVLIDGFTEGADYGYDYILTARYLSTFQKHPDTDMYIDAEGNYNMTGPEGGFASICNKNYAEIVNSIMTDAIGRVASHNLKGYPISSTIRVALKNPGDDAAILLTRGASSNGWQYDASQNAITLSGVEKAESKSYLAISYVLWKFNAG